MEPAAVEAAYAGVAGSAAAVAFAVVAAGLHRDPFLPSSLVGPLAPILTTA